MLMTMSKKLSEKPALQMPRVHCTLRGMEGAPLQMPLVQCGGVGVAGGAAAG